MAVATKVLSQVVRDRVVAHALAAAETFTPYLSQIVANNPFKDASAILSRADVNKALNGALASGREKVKNDLRAGWQAGQLLGVQEARAEFEHLGLDFPPEFAPPSSSDYLASVLADVETAFADARSDVHSGVARVFGEVDRNPEGTPNQPLAVARMRAAAIPDAVSRAVRRCAARNRAAAMVVVPRAANEARLGAYRALRDLRPDLSIHKEWQTTSAEPCPTCKALNGSIWTLDEEFDHGATADARLLPPGVYRDLLAPPRHPNCQCRLVLVVATAPEALAAELERPLVPAQPEEPETESMTADEVREMPESAYQALVGFIGSVVSTVRRFLGRPQNGPGRHRRS